MDGDEDNKYMDRERTMTMEYRGETHQSRNGGIKRRKDAFML